MSGLVPAIQAWRWMEQGGHRRPQSYIVRVPADELDAELARLREERMVGLPFASIVEVEPAPPDDCRLCSLLIQTREENIAILRDRIAMYEAEIAEVSRGERHTAYHEELS